MDEIIENLKDNINRLFDDCSRTIEWENEVKCSEAIKNLCIAYACLTRKEIKWVSIEENNLKKN